MTRPFLALTAHEEFWDTTRPIIFLGAWCTRHDRKAAWEALDHRMAPHVWSGAEAVLDGIHFCRAAQERILPRLARALNRRHGMDKDERYYRILLGDWLTLYIRQLYDKFLTLTTALRDCPEAETWLLDERDHYVPLDYNDFVTHLHGLGGDDRYPLQLYSGILQALGFSFPVKRLAQPLQNQDRDGYLNSGGPPSRMDRLLRIAARLGARLHGSTLLLTRPYLTHNRAILSLLIRSRFRCVFDDMNDPVSIPFTLDREFRDKPLQDTGDHPFDMVQSKDAKTQRRKDAEVTGDHQFDMVLSKTLPRDLPSLFLEAFAAFRAHALASHIHNAKALFTANALYGGNAFKFFAAEHAGRMPLLVMQHGAGYGLSIENNNEYFERSVCDRFYTWGWRRDEKTVPLSPTVLISTRLRLRALRGQARNDTVLFGLSIWPRYVFFLEAHPEGALYQTEIVDTAKAFLGAFAHPDKVLIRAAPEAGFGWGTKTQYAALGLPVRFDDLSVPLEKRLAHCRVFLSNNPGTAFLQAMFSDIPVVLFPSPKIFRYHEDAQPVMDALERAEVLHATPEAAARHLDRVYDNIQDWWRGEAVRAARQTFLDRFCRCEPDWAGEWVAEFTRILDS